MIKERFSRTILDQDGCSHSFELGSDFPLLNEERCEVMSIGPDSIRLAPTMHPTHVLSFAPDAFWLGLVGDQPTEAEAGQLFAHYITQWAAARASTRTIAALQSLLAVHENPHISHQDLFLPNYRFDSVTQQLLEAFDGTEEITRFLARILKQDEATVIHWAQLAGKMVSVNMEENDARDAQPPQFAETGSLPAASKQKGKAPHFRWCGEMVEQLVAAFHSHEGPCISAIIEEIASRHNWPLTAVKYKLYELKLPQQKRAGQEQEQAENLGADRQAEIPQDQPDQQRDLVLQLGETSVVVPVPSITDEPQREQVFRWDDEKIQQLKDAFMESKAESASAVCREIVERFGWPLTKVTSKVNILHLPGYKLNRQRAAAAAQTPKIIRENELSIGHFVWRVLIDGNPTQWRLDYNYGNFPEGLRGTEIFYQGCLYLVDQIFVQELRVETCNIQSADQGKIESLLVSA